MVTNLLVWLGLLIGTVFFVWLTFRAFRAKYRFVKWVGIVLCGLLALILVLVTVVSGMGLSKLYLPPSPALSPITVAGNPQQVARGEHIASILCVSCHSPNKQLPLVGGRDIAASSPMPIGSLVAYNLTPAGPLKNWSDAEIFRAMRKGFDSQGRSLIAMSSLAMRYLSDEDLQAVIAYLRSQPAAPSSVSNQGDSPNLIYAIFTGANLVSAPEPVNGTITAPARGSSVEYGKYIVSFEGCTDCHGADLTGGAPGGFTPVGPSLRVVKGWSKDQFISTLRTGTDPAGAKLDPQRMEWDIFGRMDDEELGAVYAYLSSLPPVQK